MGTNSKVTIRKAVSEDMHQVYVLIKALAACEKREETVVEITAETLIEDGFGSNPPIFGCFVAEIANGPIVGYAIYYNCYTTLDGRSIFLEDFFMDPDYRRRGIGKELIAAVAKIACDTSGRLDLNVLAWNPAMEFYNKFGAINVSHAENRRLFRFDEAALTKLCEY